MSGHPDTICALATPVGTSAVALVRVSGPESARLAAVLCGRSPPPRLALHRDYRDCNGALLDDVILTFFAAPHSYTGEDSLEISCHGNPFIAQRILEDLLARGCRSAGPGEFTLRAFLGGRMDLSQAEAVMDLIQARSERALAVANQQLRGALGRHLGPLMAGLLAALARVEAYIDFPEEDLPTEDRDSLLAELRRLETGTRQLLATSHYGELLRDGIHTVIVGPPNAGKSSLLNRLLGRDRALVSSEPGTTRDFIEERMIMGPHSLRLIDTAGLNPSPLPLEKLGMAKTLECMAEADLLLLVLDATQPAPALPSDLAQILHAKNAIVILNKSDLPAANHVGISLDGVERIRLSALTGNGIEQLKGAIIKLAESFQISVGEDIVAINSRHADALSRALLSLEGAQAKLQNGEPAELLASDLRSVLEACGEISGKIDNERMLDQLFAAFCIGK